MNFRHLKGLAVIVTVMFLGLMAAAGCGGPGEGELTIGQNVPEIAQDAAMVDLEVIRGDSELLKEAGEVLGALNRSLGNTGVGSSDVGRAVSFVMNNRRVLIVDGSFDTEEVATRLEETGHAVRLVEETDVWSGDAGNIALLGPGRLAMSYDFTTLESALSQLSAGRTLDLVEAAREVLERMGGTAYVSVTTRCESVAPGCQALGFSASGKGGPAGAFDLVTWYASVAEAEAARQSFQEFVSTEGLFDEATALVEGQSHIAMGEGHPSEIFRGADSEFRLRP